MLTNFVEDIKQQLFYQLIINHFIIENNYMIWSPGGVSVEFRDFPQRHCFSMLLSIL